MCFLFNFGVRNFKGLWLFNLFGLVEMSVLFWVGSTEDHRRCVLLSEIKVDFTVGLLSCVDEKGCVLVRVLGHAAHVSLPVLELYVFNLSE